MEDSEVIVSSVEIIKDRLYFTTLKDGFAPKQTKATRYFDIEDEIMYEAFYNDFGPYHLCHLFQFCMKLQYELGKNLKKKIVFYTSNDECLRLNAAYLMGSYQIIYHKKTPEEVYDLLVSTSDWTLLEFRDASGGPALFDISLLDVFRGLDFAHRNGFFDFKDFDEEQYLFYEKVENGDLNWIVPGKMLAFSGPHSKSWIDHGYPLHSPEHYHHYFRLYNVTTIVRLNKKSYEARQFTEFGFDHKDLFFVDGSVPSDLIVNRFLRIAEQTKGALAVHCKAGLGRTGTLIACYMMKHWGFRARDAIAWLRICRPGSVIGHQQWFLEKIEQRMLKEGEVYRKARNIPVLKFKHGIYSSHIPEPLKQENTNIRDWSSKKKLDNENALNANIKCDNENNVTTVISRVKNTPTLMKAKPLTRKHFIPPMNNIKNNNVKTVNQTVKNNKLTAVKTSTFPPNRSAPVTLGKMATNTNVKSNLTADKTAKTYARKNVNQKNKVQLVTATLTTLTENCHLNPIKVDGSLISSRKKSLLRSTSSTRGKISKSGNSEEPMECYANHSIITADVTADNFIESVNSQGNRLYKIKALRKCNFGLKKDGVRTRSSSLNAVRKK